jgi:hypothetical protein
VSPTAIQDGSRQRFVGLEPHQREECKLERLRFGGGRRLVVRLHGRHCRRAPVLGGDLPDGRRGGLCGGKARAAPDGDQAECLGCVAANEWRGVAECDRKRLDGGHVTDESQCERRHLAHFRIRVLQRHDERRHAFWQPGAADGKRGAASDPRFRIRQ